MSFRFIKDESVNFYPGLKHKVFHPLSQARPCTTVDDLDLALAAGLADEIIPGKTAVFLSGGIDSAIIAAYMPPGTVAYTFKCLAPGAIDETGQAGLYAERFDLDHRIVEIEWADFPNLLPEILKFNQVPVHSIEIQLYKAALLAKSQGVAKILVGESADLIYGGMDQLLGRDWGFDEFVNRYTFVNPELVLHEPVSMGPVYEEYRLGDKVDLLRFMDEIFSIESSSSYMHAFELAGLDYFDPYAATKMAQPLDLARVRGGEPKYLVRDLFRRKYPDLEVPDKIAMPRPMDQWLEHWSGPRRPEFKTDCVENLSGDQKWLVYCLEAYLNIFEPL